MSKFIDSDYFKSDEHIKNAKNAIIKGNQKIQQLKQERIDEYNRNPKKCKYCNTKISYERQHRIYCNSSCAASFNNKQRILSETTKEKIRNKLKGRKYNTNLLTKEYFTKICPECQIEYKTRKKKQIYCSRNCARKNNGCCESARKKISIKSRERVKNGTHNG